MSPPIFWSDQQFQAVLQTVHKLRGRIYGVPDGQWWSALLHVLRDTGCRVSQLLAADIRGLVHDPPSIVLPAKTGGLRSHAIQPTTLAAVAAIIRGRAETGPLFPWLRSPLGAVRKDLLHRDFRCLLERAAREANDPTLLQLTLRRMAELPLR